MVRAQIDLARVRRLMEELGRRARGAGHIYLTGGASAVLIGWRTTTIDVDLKLDPEPAGVFEAIREVKEALSINIELAAPDQFVPALPAWRDRSVSIGRFGPVEFSHYDFYSQAFAKVERGHRQDLEDARQMVARQLVELPRLLELFASVEKDLVRYPALNPMAVRAKLESFAAAGGGR